MTSINSTSPTSGAVDEKQQKGGDLFKPVQEKSQDEVTLESLRASKLTSNSSADDVKAPGIFGRVKEEVEAIAESFQEEHLNHKSSGNQNGQGGCFSWLGFGEKHKTQQNTPNESQSQ